MKGVRPCVLAMALVAGTPSAQILPDIRWMRGGHSADITALVYSSDGTFFVSGALDNTIKIWRSSDSMLLETLILPGGTRAVALSPDDATVCGGGFGTDGIAIVRCWHVSDGTQAWSARLTGVAASEPVAHLAFSPDGTRLTASAGFRLPVFDASNGSPIADFSNADAPNPPYNGGGLAYSPDGNVLAVNRFEHGGANSRLALLNAATGTLAWDTADPNSVAYDVAFSPDSQLVASVNGTGMRVFNTYAHTSHPFPTGPPAKTVAFSPDGTRVATDWAGAAWLNLFDVSTGTLTRQWNAHGTVGSQLSLAFSPDGTKLLSGVFDLKRWKALDGAFDALVSAQVGPAWLLALSADEKVVAVATNSSVVGTTDEHAICLYRASDGGLLRYIDYGPAVLRGLAISPDGHHVAASDSQKLRVWNIDSGALERSTDYAGGGSYRPVAYTPDGSGIAAGGDVESIVSLWNPGTGTLTPIVAGAATALRFLPAPDGRLVIARQVTATSFESVVRIVTLGGHVDREMFGLQNVAAIAVSPDGTAIAATGLDGAFTPFYVTRLWRVSDAAPMQTLVGHTSLIGGLSFSWDSKTVITGARDGTVRIWRVLDGTQLHLYDAETYMAAFPILNPGVHAVVASARSGRFLYGRADGTIVAAVNPDAQPAILSFTVPATVTGSCKTVTGKVILNGPAPPSGLTVLLSSSSSDASVPASLVFKAGASSKSFKIKTAAVGALEAATISATLDTDTQDRHLDIRPIGVSGVTLSPSPVIGGSPVAGGVTLECKAGPGDVFVNLSSSIPAAAQPGVAGITIPEGGTQGTFTVTTSQVSKTKKPAIGAATVDGAVSAQKKLVVNP